MSMQEKEIVFALSQIAYGACLLLGYWGYFVLFRPVGSSNLFPFRYMSYLQRNLLFFANCLSQVFYLILFMYWI